MYKCVQMSQFAIQQKSTILQLKKKKFARKVFINSPDLLRSSLIWYKKNIPQI